MTDKNNNNQAPSNYELHTDLIKLEGRLMAVEKKVDTINSHISKLVWIIITAVVLAILKVTIGG